MASTSTPSPSFVYLLQSSNQKITYVGATVDLTRRLRQHNQEIKGGAKATGRQVQQGHTWHRIAYVSGFPNWQATLQFEWRWKQLTRKIKNKKNNVERRMMALIQLLGLPQSTSKAIPFELWETPPEIHFEENIEVGEKAKEIFQRLSSSTSSSTTSMS